MRPQHQRARARRPSSPPCSAPCGASHARNPTGRYGGRQALAAAAASTSQRRLSSAPGLSFSQLTLRRLSLRPPGQPASTGTGVRWRDSLKRELNIARECGGLRQAERIPDRFQGSTTWSLALLTVAPTCPHLARDALTPNLTGRDHIVGQNSRGSASGARRRRHRHAIVDIIGRCDEAFSVRHGCAKGSMQLVDAPRGVYEITGPAVRSPAAGR